MSTQIAVRLPDDLDTDVETLARQMHLKRSDIVRLALKKFVDEKLNKEDKPYDRVKNLLGSVSSGIPDLGEDHREYLLKRFKKDA